VIRFSDDDYARISFPHSDTLVVTLTIANHNVHRILVDNGCSVDISYWSVFKKLNLGQKKIILVQSPFIGFAGEQVQLLGAIKLPVTAGTVPRQVTIMVKFLL
jgi:hypothetical protein